MTSSLITTPDPNPNPNHERPSWSCYPPQPEIAEQLDITFKHMGFHQKSLGPAAKDLVLKPYALPKHAKLVDPHKRRLSLSHKVPSVVERVRAFSPEGRAKALRASSPQKPSSPAKISTRISSSSKV
jgi:hypothetical protein